MIDYKLRDIKFLISKHKDSRRIISTKTKFLDNYIYECKNLTEWLRYKDWNFRYKEVLFFLEIPIKNFEMDIKEFSLKVEEKFNGNFLGLLKKIEIYFNQENGEIYVDRLRKMSDWEQGRIT